MAEPLARVKALLRRAELLRAAPTAGAAEAVRNGELQIQPALRQRAGGQRAQPGRHRHAAAAGRLRHRQALRYPLRLLHPRCGYAARGGAP